MNLRRRHVLWLPALLLSVVGCQDTTGFRLLRIVPSRTPPLVIGMPTENPITALNPLTSYEFLCDALKEELDQPVTVEPCFPFQTEPNLNSGLHQIAIVTPWQFASFSRPRGDIVIAIAADKSGRSARSALLVVPADSPVRAASDLRGKHVAFGRKGDSRSHAAGLVLLRENGLNPLDLALEMLPVPGSLRHIDDPHLLALTVASGKVDAGFLDEATWEQLPERDGRNDEPTRAKMRVIARTVALPDQLIIRSDKLDDAKIRKIRSAFFAMQRNYPSVLTRLGCSGYREPMPATVDACLTLVSPGVKLFQN
ncbi:MAG: PhnD/SsuA/transferrin family substrate-binding protein [Phycisphaerales bacterium]|nr:PhnD/SsuA/transferrin family substrate-binding protein [Phycisphaerales bacterium]